MRLRKHLPFVWDSLTLFLCLAMAAGGEGLADILIP